MHQDGVGYRGTEKIDKKNDGWEAAEQPTTSAQEKFAEKNSVISRLLLCSLRREAYFDFLVLLRSE